MSSVSFNNLSTNEFGYISKEAFIKFVFNKNDIYECPTDNVFEIIQEYRCITNPRVLSEEHISRIKTLDEHYNGGIVTFMKDVYHLCVNQKYHYTDSINNMKSVVRQCTGWRIVLPPKQT